MIIPDVNVLVYAYNDGAVAHSAARQWWEDTLNGTAPVGLAWVTLLGFIRTTTHRRILANPLSVTDSLRRVHAWLERPRVQILTPGERHAEILSGFLLKLGTAGDLTTDAHLAALAVEYHAELASCDNDFCRFPNLRWFNPLRASRQSITPPA